MVSTDGGRRTQDERSASTRKALLDETMRSLATVGWTGTSARAVAESAGVSQGAQQYHFPTKADLVEAAVVRLIQDIARALDEVPSWGGTEPERAGRLLDFLCEVHQLPATAAVVEIMAVARVDAANVHVAELLVSATDHICDFAARVLPDYAEHPGFRETVLLALAAARGTAVADLPGAESSRPSWSSLRANLLRLFEELGDRTPQKASAD